MTDEERRQVESRSIMKLVGGTQPEEKKPEPKKTGKEAKK